MFTGIIKHKSKITRHKKNKGSLYITIANKAKWVLENGESIAVDGTCLTVKESSKKEFSFELMPETLKKTTFGTKIPHEVNLERSLQLKDKISGHFVTGHVDTTGKIESVKKEGTSKIFTISYPVKFNTLLVSKGSITVNGVSLTITKIEKNNFSVAILPYTIKETTLGENKKGDKVNLEFDILAKYINK